MTEQTFKVGDRVRITRTYENGDTAVFESTVRHVYDDGDVSADTVFYDASDEIQTIEKIAPAEPKGLGAVVRDEDGDILVRVHDATDLDDEVWRTTEGSWHAWADLNVVEVLSEGIVVE